MRGKRIAAAAEKSDSGKHAVPQPFDVALQLLHKSEVNWKTYRALVELAADCGDSTAIYARATWYLNGFPEIGVRRDVRKGMQLVRKAATHSLHAMYKLGVCYATGSNGLRMNEKRAFVLFERSASLGCLAAMKMHAYFLGSGQGVTADPRRATKLLARATALERKFGELHPDPEARNSWQ